MKLLILHLSDIHFQDHGNYTEENLDAIVSALQESIRHVQKIIIFISGDIAFSGYKSQYTEADNFIETLKEKISARYNYLNDINVFVVPGNHDVNYDLGCLSSSDLKAIESNNEYDNHIPDELKKMRSFLKFANKYDCFKNQKSLIDIKYLKYDNKTIQINLINSGVFSSIEEDQGYHYLPKSNIDKLSENRKSDYVFTIMHHPHHWYTWRVKKDLERVLYERNDMLFFGHEHYDSQMRVSNPTSSVILNEGGQLCNSGNWDTSSFYVDIIDLDSRKFQSVLYSWDKEGRVYCSTKKSENTIFKNRANSLGMSPKEEYIKALLRDDKFAISDRITDYFVFPLLYKKISEKKSYKELDEIENLFSEIESEKRLCIQGNNDSGKTTLARFLFASMSSTKVVIYLDSENIRKATSENIVRDSFAQIYSDIASDFEKFKQLTTDEKVIIIDDTDKIPDEYLQDFLLYAEDNFGYIILFSQNEIEFDIAERLNNRKLSEKYTFYGIRPFYKDRRNELVSKIVHILVKNNSETQDKIIETVTDILNTKKNDFNWNPDFIVQLTKYYCNNVGESIQNDGNIYSKVFESNLTSLLKPFLKKGMTADKAFIVLDKIAYQMHISKSDPISLQAIDSVIKKYNDDFGSNIYTGDFINMVLKAGILRKFNGQYRFTRRNYLAYFVAREIKRICLQNGDYSDFTKALEYSCYPINADIVLFVTYITDNINLIDLIMDIAEQYTNEWESFSADPIKVEYLVNSENIFLPKVTEKDKKQDEKAVIEHEKEETEFQKLKSHESVYNYEEGELEFNSKLFRGVSLMNVVSRILPNFEHMMPKNDKARCVDLIYNLPLKIFNVWASEVDNHKYELINELRNIDDYRYRNEKLFKNETDIVKFLRWESMSLLLDLMSSSITDASKDNTYMFLNEYEYNSKMMYELEHLMELGKKDSVDSFVKTACNLYDKAKQGFTKTMVQRVVRRYIINSKRITSPDIQRLNSKIFNEGLKNTLVIRHIAQKEQ